MLFGDIKMSYTNGIWFKSQLSGAIVLLDSKWFLKSWTPAGRIWTAGMSAWIRSMRLHNQLYFRPTFEGADFQFV